MIEAIYNVYSDYNNIIDIYCKRLKYLKMVLETKVTIEDALESPQEIKIKYLDKKYNWERESLSNKFLIEYDFYRQSYIPEEIIDKIKLALKNVKWKEKQKIDELNEILVSYCKMQGSALLDTVISVGSGITGLLEEIIWNHVLTSKLFNYYVFIVEKDFETLGENVPLAIYQDYYEIEEEIEEQRKNRE